MHMRNNDVESTMLMQQLLIGPRPHTETTSYMNFCSFLLRSKTGRSSVDFRYRNAPRFKDAFSIVIILHSASKSYFNCSLPNLPVYALHGWLPAGEVYTDLKSSSARCRWELNLPHEFLLLSRNALCANLFCTFLFSSGDKPIVAAALCAFSSGDM
jgi:hypothetical protein